MKSLYPNVDWNVIQTIGFDMDGTLYDELLFIEQVYAPISSYIASVCLGNPEKIYVEMVERWKEKGSSYPYIFSEILTKHHVGQDEQLLIVQECLRIFRSFKPQLILLPDVKSILTYFQSEFELFLVTDGHAELQTNKIRSLGLKEFFSPTNIGISGVYGKEYQKPSLNIVKHISSLDNKKPRSVLYFGDREVDEQFAIQAGFQFVRVKCMQTEVSG